MFLQAKKGDTVLWAPDYTTQEWIPAIVTREGAEAISVKLILDNSMTIPGKSGVRHISDPKAKQPEFLPGGVWKHRDVTLKVAELLEALGTQEKKK